MVKSWFIAVKQYPFDERLTIIVEENSGFVVETSRDPVCVTLVGRLTFYFIV